MNRTAAFVLWLMPILFLVVDIGNQGLLEGVTFWFFVVAMFLFLARSSGVTGESDDQNDDQPQARSREEFEELERAVETYLVVQGSKSDHERVEFEGTLRTAPEETVAALERVVPDNKVTLSKGQSGSARIILTRRGGVEVPREKPTWWVQVALFSLAILTTTWVGASKMGVDLVSEPSRFSVGLPFSPALLAILSAHEFGHYFAARRHGMTVTLPYFIPVPVALGTFGAFVGLKSRAPNRKALFDVAVAGPLAGLALAVPTLWWGLQSSTVLDGSARVEFFFRSVGVDVGSSFILAILSKLALGSALLEGHRVVLSPLALAGWFGMIITALNLLPIARLDGGYITHAVLGVKRAKMVSIIGLIAVFLSAFSVSSYLLMWAFVIFFVASTRNILPSNDLSRVGIGRAALGYLALALVLLIFVPVPDYFYPFLKIHSLFA